MDPYRTLGVPRGCTRQEAKAAFRAKAWQVHPDRGGNEQAFIEFDTAYRLILRELDSALSHTGGSAKGPSPSPVSHAFEPNFDPEVIVLGGAPASSRSPRAPDPDWNPEIILLDQPPRSAKPFDPDWKPDIIMLDEPSCPVTTPDSNSAFRSYYSWFRGLPGINNNRGKSIAFPAWTHGILTTMFLILLVVVLLILLAAGGARKAS